MAVLELQTHPQPLVLLPILVAALSFLAAATALGEGDCLSDTGQGACERVDLAAGEPGAALGLLQRESGKHRPPASAGAVGVEGSGAGGEDLVLQHIPFNFGHTTEKVAAFGSGEIAMAKYYAFEGVLSMNMPREERWAVVNRTYRPGAEVWGHSNPDLFETSKVTGCPLYFTPGKYWPKDIAQSYFGNKTIFGMLRDPYERLVAMFRGNLGAYGGWYPEFIPTCDVNGAVRKMMTDYLAGEIYAKECCFVPQAEYFDAPFGITLAVDNRRFPTSLNEIFADHGYTDLHIETEDILHVTGCPEVWAGDLDCETKALVKQVYARDFELLRERFGYCDQEENCCIEGVPLMCPSNLDEKRKTATRCA